MWEKKIAPTEAGTLAWHKISRKKAEKEGSLFSKTYNYSFIFNQATLFPRFAGTPKYWWHS